MYDLINIFDVFLPQLLLYPNPTDPLNSEAANFMLKDPDKYKEKVKEYVKKYASVGKGKEVKSEDGQVEKEAKISTEEVEDEKPKENQSEPVSELSVASVDNDDEDEI